MAEELPQGATLESLDHSSSETTPPTHPSLPQEQEAQRGLNTEDEDSPNFTEIAIDIDEETIRQDHNDDNYPATEVDQLIPDDSVAQVCKRPDTLSSNCSPNTLSLDRAQSTLSNGSTQSLSNNASGRSGKLSLAASIAASVAEEPLNDPARPPRCTEPLLGTERPPAEARVISSLGCGSPLQQPTKHSPPHESPQIAQVTASFF